MVRTFLLALLLPLAACSGLPSSQVAPSPSPCAAGENTYACQVERYHNISG
jgi:hypothetical protein